MFNLEVNNLLFTAVQSTCMPNMLLKIGVYHAGKYKCDFDLLFIQQ